MPDVIDAAVTKITLCIDDVSFRVRHRSIAEVWISSGNSIPCSASNHIRKSFGQKRGVQRRLIQSRGYLVPAYPGSCAFFRTWTGRSRVSTGSPSLRTLRAKAVVANLIPLVVTRSCCFVTAQAMHITRHLHVSSPCQVMIPSSGAVSITVPASATSLKRSRGREHTGLPL